MFSIILKAYHLIALSMLCLILSCNSQPDYKLVRQEVVAKHDKLMVYEEQLIENRRLLNNILQKQFKKTSKNDLKEKEELLAIIQLLDKADENMMSWMRAFKVDIEGKTKKEALAYFQTEKLKLMEMEKQFKIALLKSQSYLKSKKD
ncbi:hypothetical protein [Pedobacter glucosidilyticus]|uniref:hypothetical protein n=1 Tax=Pedobacter glucosidilyticus TaxID=1122941 RepID=UPI0026EA09EF|nr:hypothetical protein [Pedobacter glucosidilyticus]